MADSSLVKCCMPTNAQVLKAFEREKSAASLHKNLCVDFPDAEFHTYDIFVLYTKIQRLNNKCKLLKKNKKENDLQVLLCSSFMNMKPNQENQISGSVEMEKCVSAVKQCVSKVVEENLRMKRKVNVTEQNNENLTLQIQHAERKIDVLQNLLEITNDKYKQVCAAKKESVRLREELEEWESRYENLSKQFDEAVEDLHEKKLKLQKQSTRNVNKKIKRRDDIISDKTDVIFEKECEIVEKERELNDVRKENVQMKNELDNLKREKKNLLVKVCRLKKSKNDLFENNLKKIEELKLEISNQDKNVKRLEEINALISDPVIDTFYDGKFSNEIRETVMTLVTECGVSQSKVNLVLQTVLKNLTGKTLSRLPSTGVKSRLLLEAKRVANQQVAQALIDGSFTLHQDGTSKFHKHFQSFQVTGDGITLSAGIVEVGKGDASTLFDTFSTLLSDLVDTIKSGDRRDCLAKLVTSIIATMSDQGSVNHVFTEKFQEFRQELLPVAYENWNTLSIDNQQKLGELFSFFCKMHIFVNMASETDKCLKNLEDTIIAEGRNPYAFHSTESGTSRLVRTVSKAFTSHGCEKSGVGGHFLTYLQEKGIKNHLITFRGHRFNHLFHAAGCTYYHISDICDFLQKWADPNELLRSISFDIRECLYLAGARALGLIDKLVTGPLWRIIEKVPNSLSLNTHLYQLMLNLENWSKDASTVLEGECVFSEDLVSVTKDCIYESLVTPAEDALLDTYTQMALEICFSAMLIILERQCKDQLPGGKYWDLEPAIVDQLSTVPTTNTVSERDFAQLDVLMRTKPSASTTTYESIVMWTNNKTSNWLNSIPADEKLSILNDARLHVPDMTRKLKERQQNLFEVKLNNLKERQAKKAKHEEKQHSNKVKLTQKIQETGGLWVSIEDFETFKASCNSNTELKEGILSQLLFRKQVLGSKGSKELFQQSHKGKSFSTEDLQRNIVEVINLNLDEASVPSEPKLIYKEPVQVEHDVKSLKITLSGKIEENRKKMLISQQKQLLPTLKAYPDKLVGRKIKHKCRDPVTRTVEWFKGEVVDIFKRHENVLKIEYHVRYDDDDDDDLWHFPLLKDMENGDIIISN